MQLQLIIIFLCSLDQADPNMTHHPFNKMTFSPFRLTGSLLLQAMLHADYILKSLTVGNESQHFDTDPDQCYKQRPIDQLLDKFSPALKVKIIECKLNKQNFKNLKRIFRRQSQLILHMD
jgi:hypothetical protein